MKHITNITLLYDNGRKGDLGNICHSCTVLDLMDAAEDTKARYVKQPVADFAEIFAKNISDVTKQKWTVNRITDSYVRLINVDRSGNANYLRGDFAG